MINYLVATWT